MTMNFRFAHQITIGFFCHFKKNPTQLLHEKLSIKLGKLSGFLFQAHFSLLLHTTIICDDRIISKPSLHTVVCKP